MRKRRRMQRMPHAMLQCTNNGRPNRQVSISRQTHNRHARRRSPRSQPQRRPEASMIQWRAAAAEGEREEVDHRPPPGNMSLSPNPSVTARMVRKRPRRGARSPTPRRGRSPQAPWAQRKKAMLVSLSESPRYTPQRTRQPQRRARSRTRSRGIRDKMQVGKVIRPDRPETEVHSPRQRGATEEVAFDMAAAHADNIEDMVKYDCAKEGGPSQAAQTFAATQIQDAQPGTHARAKQLAMA